MAATAIPELTLVALSDDRVQGAGLVQHYEREAAARYGPFIRCLLRPMYNALEAEVVEGFALIQGRRTAGMVCYARYGGLGRITFLHVRDEARGRGLEGELLAAAVEDIRSGPAAVARIVGEPMVTSDPEPERLFEQLGLSTVAREIMCAHLGRGSRREPRGGVAALVRRGVPLALRSWKAGDMAGGAEVLRQANQGSIDGLIYPELLDQRQVLAAVKGICRGSCGKLDARASSVLTVRASAEVIGVAMVARYPSTDAFLAEVAVLPEWQGQGLGAALLDRSLAHLATKGCERVALGVTTGNRRARDLYASRGFERVDTFASHYWPA